MQSVRREGSLLFCLPRNLPSHHFNLPDPASLAMKSFGQLDVSSCAWEEGKAGLGFIPHQNQKAKVDSCIYTACLAWIWGKLHLDGAT